MLEKFKYLAAGLYILSIVFAYPCSSEAYCQQECQSLLLLAGGMYDTFDDDDDDDDYHWYDDEDDEDDSEVLNQGPWYNPNTIFYNPKSSV